MFGLPEETRFDLRFQLLGVPVRVHPMFWLVTAAMGGNQVEHMFLWVICVFVSLIVHEFGHALMNKAHGLSPAVMLHGFGGLCYTEDGRTVSPGRRLATIAAGPGAGLAFCCLILAFLNAKLGVHPLDALAAVGLGPGDPMRFATAMVGMKPQALVFIYMLIYVNCFWSLVNLLPVYPLDGGQIMEVIVTGRDPWNGRALVHKISVIVGFGAAFWLGTLGQFYAALMFGMLALNNLQMARGPRLF